MHVLLLTGNKTNYNSYFNISNTIADDHQQAPTPWSAGMGPGRLVLSDLDRSPGTMQCGTGAIVAT